MPRPDLILHIGHSKTGTSSIQRVLGARRDALLELGVCYPRSPGHANHGLLPASLVPVSMLSHFNPALWEGVGPEARLARFRREFAAELAALPPQTRRIVISAEQCGGLLTTKETVSALREMLAPHAERITVVMYLRRQDGHAASSYTQSLRIAHIRPPALPAGGPERLPQYDYAATLDLWASVFGEEAIRPRIFERAAMKNGDAVDDFLDLCDIPLVVPVDDPDRQANVSIAPEGLSLMLAMGTHLQQALPGGLTPSSSLWRRFSAAVGEALPGRGWRPSAAEAQEFVSRFARTNEAVRRRWFPERPSLFSTEFEGGAGSGALPAAEGTLAAACRLLTSELQAAAEREASQLTQIGRLQAQAGDARAARAAFRAALRADPSHRVALMRLAELDIAEGDRAGAEAHLAALRRIDPAEPAIGRLERRLGPAGARAAS